jgi:choline-sulfatase
LRGETESHRDVIFFEYLENEEAAVKTEDWKLIYCSGRRHRQDGYETHDPTPGRYLRLYSLRDDPAELNNLAGKPEYENLTGTMKRYLLTRFLTTHPDAPRLPIDRTIDAKLDWFLQPRDAESSA